MKRLIIVALLGLSIFTQKSSASIVINEFLASNSEQYQDPQEPGEYPDWIELYNTGSQTINLAGYYLTDIYARPTKWQIPQGVQIPANGFIFFIADSDDEQGNIHTNFKLDSAGGFIGLVNSDGLTFIDSLTYKKQYSDVSYGRSPDGSVNWYYFDQPTMNSKNQTNGYLGKIAKVQFSQKHGFYEADFNLSLSVEHPDAKIYYTLDGSEPKNHVSGGTKIYSSPIQISTTTCVRAQAFQEGWESKNSVTNTYIFLDDVIYQPENPGGFPQNWGWTGNGDYEMDPEVVDAAAYRNTIKDDMKSISSLSLVMDVDDWFGAGGQGIYPQGELDERAVSAELINPNGTQGFQINCAVMIVGGTSVNRWKMDKLSMRLKFQNEYGAADLDYPFFGDDATDVFQTLVLDARMNNSWAYGGGVGISGRNLIQNDIAQYTRDQFVANLHAETGGLAVHGRQVFLYLNGLYWGLYWVHERPDEHFAAAYRGGNAEDYDVIKHNPNNTVSGDNENYKQLFSIANSGRSITEKYELLSIQLDIPDFIHYMIINYYVGNMDWAHQNWYVSRSKFPPENKWRYHSWDAEHVMEGLSDNSTSRDDDGAPTRLHHVLKQHPEYKRQFADQVYNLFFNDGLLTPVQLRKHYQELLDEIDRAVVGESARWGDNHRDQPYTRNVEWIEERDWLMDVYFEERSDIVLDQIRSQDLFPNVIAPIFLVDGSVQPGGEIIKGASLSMSAPRGTIYYTTNGTDPFVIDHSSTNSQILVPQNATKWAYCPDSDIGNTWRIDIDYDHSGWSKCEGGPGGIGYERDSGYESLITLDTENEMWDANDNAATSCFIRIPFDVSADQLEKIVSLKLNMRYDDGFAAYLNGLKVANENVPTSPRWESVALGNHEAASIESYDITSDQSRLNAGKNILAIHGMNVHAHSSDFIITAELVTSDEATEGTVSPDAKIYSAPLTLNESTEIKARAKNGSTWSPVHRAVFAIAEKMDALKLTEIHYHPLDSNDTNDREFEFVELKNISTTAINLSLSGFQNGIRYTLGGGVILQPGKFIVLASNSEKFKSRYGYAPFDQYEGNLDNAGERIVFTNAAGDTIINVRFNDKDPWPAGADGDGYSLVAVDVNPQKDPNDPTYWGVSYKLHGSPGRDDNTATIVVKSETPPIRYDLRQNYPNPFNPSTTIQFDVPLSSHVKLDIYNVLGQHVVTLTDDQYRPGTFTIRWDAVNCAAGVYFYRIKAGEFLSIKKLILVK